MRRIKAIIGGTGVYSLGLSKLPMLELSVTTPYGDVSLTKLSTPNVDVVFLSRHGEGHSTPPDQVNYRANMYALKQLGVNEVYAICAVGSLREEFAPGMIVEIVDFIDFTKNRIVSYYTGADSVLSKEVVHIDCAEPYSSNLRKKMKLKDTENMIAGEGVYVCTEGPRFESKAEVRMFRQLGGDLLGMTNIPEVTLANELGLNYAAYGIVTNYGTGMEGAVHNFEEIKGIMEDSKNYLIKKFMEIFETT